MIVSIAKGTKDVWCDVGGLIVMEGEKEMSSGFKVGGAVIEASKKMWQPFQTFLIMFLAPVMH